MSTPSIGTSPVDLQAVWRAGVDAHRAGRWAEALSRYQDVADHLPDRWDLLTTIGTVALQLNRLGEGVDWLSRSLKLNPAQPSILALRGVALSRLDRLDEALASLDEAIHRKGDFAEAYLDRGCIYQRLAQPERALEDFDQAIALAPGYTEAHSNRGAALHELARYREALDSYNAAIACDPAYPTAQWNKACLKILLGEYAEGWALYEWRWKAELKGAVRELPRPLWIGEHPIAGRTLLIHAEQGFGDFIQCSRYVPMVEELGARVVLEAPKELAPVVSTLRGRFDLICRGESLPPFDFQCPVMSLPLAMKTTVSTIPDRVPYLFADQAKRGRWRSRLKAAGMPRIGLAWSGSPKSSSDKRRNVPLELFGPLLDLGFEVHSLQKEVRPTDAAFLRESRICRHEEALADFSDTAALISELDLIVAVDTAVAHLAGALGKPVWILLPSRPDPRWMLERADSPWYPTARLFRQSTRGSWAHTIGEVCAALVARFFTAGSED